MAVLVRIAEQFNERGFDAILEFAHPDFEFHEPPEQPGATVFRGRDACRAGFARWSETWLEQQSEPQGIEILPDERVLVFTRERMTGRDGLRLETDCGQLITFRGSEIVRWQTFWDLDNARAAAELSG